MRIISNFNQFKKLVFDHSKKEVEFKIKWTPQSKKEALWVMKNASGRLAYDTGMCLFIIAPDNDPICQKRFVKLLNLEDGDRLYCFQENWKNVLPKGTKLISLDTATVFEFDNNDEFYSRVKDDGSDFIALGYIRKGF